MAATQEAQDPLEKGAAQWQERARGLAISWADQLDLVYLGVPLVRLLEYPMLDVINRLYEKHHDA